MLEQKLVPSTISRNFLGIQKSQRSRSYYNNQVRKLFETKIAKFTEEITAYTKFDFYAD